MTTTASSSAQATDLQFTYTFDYPQYLYNEKQQSLFMTSVQAPHFESESRTSRAPIDIVCVIDKSGSMEGGKIELVKKTFAFMIEQLKPADRISIVAFDTEVTTDLQLTSMNEDGKKKAKVAVGNLHAGTSTNLSGGLFQGFEVVDTRTTKSDVVSVLLFTDGLANHGLTNTQQIVAGIHSYYQKIGTPMSLFTFGFGSDHDANMLRAIAEAGNGLYYFIEKEEEIPESFANCLGGLLSVVAQNIKVTVTAAEGVRIVKFLSQYKKNELQKESKYEVLVGDLYSEEKRDIILEVELPATLEPQSNVQVASVQLSYFNVVNTTPQTVQLSCNVERVQAVTPGLQVSLELDKQKNRIISANALESARALADRSQLEEARKVINEAIAKISASPSGKDEYCAGLVTDLKECLVNMQDRVSYTSVGSKMMNNYWASNVYQRQTSSKSAAQKSYSTTSKQKMSESASNQIIFKR